jgi:transcription initiation factor TFIIIB Brf1 subunit/transcription initiation factor TFIIB
MIFCKRLKRSHRVLEIFKRRSPAERQKIAETLGFHEKTIMRRLAGAVFDDYIDAILIELGYPEIADISTQAINQQLEKINEYTSRAN